MTPLIEQRMVSLFVNAYNIMNFQKAFASQEEASEATKTAQMARDVVLENVFYCDNCPFCLCEHLRFQLRDTCLTRFDLSSPSDLVEDSEEDSEDEETEFECTAKLINFDEDEEGQVCSICLDPFECGQHGLQLVCGHAFHQTCALSWICEKNNSCPLCRRPSV